GWGGPVLIDLLEEACRTVREYPAGVRARDVLGSYRNVVSHLVSGRLFWENCDGALVAATRGRSRQVRPDLDRARALIMEAFDLEASERKTPR
ncbi:MAG: hypothetical protein ABIH26_11220, partial [Candidatus Eisenbacteria bacterium]